MSIDNKFNQAKGNLAFSQSIVDRFKQPQQPQQPDMGIADTTPQQITPPVAQQPTPVATPAPVAEPATQFSYRGVPVSDQERQQLKQAIFSEVSNRHSPIEISAMANVAVNKAAAEKRALSQVVTDPKFFQGVANKRYSEVPQGEDAHIMALVNQTVDKQLNDNAPDHTIGATHFVHVTSGDKKGSLVTMTEKEFAKYLSKKDGQRDVYAESLID